MKVLELESHLENERLRLGELRKKHYELAGVPLEQVSEGNGETSSLVHPGTMSPKPTKPALMKKPALAQKPNIPPKTTVRAVNKKLFYIWENKILFVGKSLICVFTSVCYSLNNAWAESGNCSTNGWLDWPEKDGLFVNIWFLFQNACWQSSASSSQLLPSFLSSFFVFLSCQNGPEAFFF